MLRNAVYYNPDGIYRLIAEKNGLYKIPDFKSEINVGQDHESSQIIISYSILGNIHLHTAS